MMKPKTIGPKHYSIWSHLFSRCYHRNSNSYKNYGARGIKVCERWWNYNNFILDIGERPLGTSLDRINNNGDYEPSNCRWATPKEQQRNQRQTRKVSIEGQEYIAADLADLAGKKVDTIINRVKRGLPYEQVISKEKFLNFEPLLLGGPISGLKRKRKTHCVHGHEYTEANTSITTRGKYSWRVCKQCRVIAARKQRLSRHRRYPCGS